MWPVLIHSHDHQKFVYKSGASSPISGIASKRSPHAPLASAEDIDQHGYAIPRDNVAGQQQQSGSSGGSRGSAGSKSKPPAGEAPRLKSNSEYAQPIEQATSSSQAPRKSKHRERRKQMALQQGIWTKGAFINDVTRTGLRRGRSCVSSWSKWQGKCNFLVT